MKDNPGIVLHDNKMESNATIIFCPNRLCSQWYEEIQKYISKYLLKIIKITTITQYRKYKLEHYTNCDIVLINFNFLKNPRYLDTEESKIRLEDILWHRIIVDEGHELLTTIRLNKDPNKFIKFIKDRPYNDKRYSVSTKKIRALGWKPKYNLIKDLPSMIDWYTNNYKLYKNCK